MVFEYYNSGIYALADQKIFSLWTMINYVHWVPAADLPKKVTIKNQFVVFSITN